MGRERGIRGEVGEKVGEGREGKERGGKGDYFYGEGEEGREKWERKGGMGGKRRGGEGKAHHGAPTTESFRRLCQPGL